MASESHRPGGLQQQGQAQAQVLNPSLPATRPKTNDDSSRRSGFACAATVDSGSHNQQLVHQSDAVVGTPADANTAAATVPMGGTEMATPMESEGASAAPQANVEDDQDWESQDVEGYESLAVSKEPHVPNVCFVVIPSQTYKPQKSDSVGIVFGHEKKLGKWAIVHPMMPIKCKKRCTIFVGYVFVPPDVYGSIRTDYRYVLYDLKNRKIRKHEHLHWRKYSQTNRTLQIPAGFTGDWIQIDGICYLSKLDQTTIEGQITQQMKEYLSRKPVASLEQLLLNDHIGAWHDLMPTLDTDGTRPVFKYWFDFDDRESYRDPASGEQSVSINIYQAISIMTSHLRHFCHVFFDDTMLNNTIFVNWVHVWLNGLVPKLRKFVSQDRIMFSMAFLQVLYHQASPVCSEQILKNLCKLLLVSRRDDIEQFGEWLNDEKRSKFNLTELSKIFEKLLDDLRFDPVIISILPLWNMIAPASSTATSHKATAWWLPLPGRLTMDFGFPAHSGDFDRAIQYLEKTNATPEIVGAVLRLYIGTPEEAVRLLKRFSKPSYVERLLAWCALWLEKFQIRSYTKHNRDFMVLFHLSADWITSSPQPNQYWISARTQRRPAICDIMIGILDAISRHGSIDVMENNSTLICLSRLTSAVEKKLEDANAPTSTVAVDALSSALNKYFNSNACSHLVPKGNWTADGAEQVLFQCMSVQLTGTRSRELWAARCTTMLDEWRKSILPSIAILNLCSRTDVAQIDHKLREHLNVAACSIAENQFSMTENCGAAITRLKSYITSDETYRLVYSHLIKKFAPPNLESITAIDFLKVFMDLKFPEMYLDPGLIKQLHLDDDATRLVCMARDKMKQAMIKCEKGGITIEFAAYLSDKTEILSKVNGLLGTPEFLENLKAIRRNFNEYVAQLKMLRKFLMPAERFENFDAFFSLLDVPDNRLLISDICDLHPSGKFQLKYSLSENLHQLANRLMGLSDNALFNIFWRNTITSTNHLLSIDDSLTAILATTETTIQEFLTSLNTLQLTFRKVEWFTGTLSDRNDKEEIVRDLCRKMDFDCSGVSTAFHRIQLYEQLKTGKAAYDDLKSLAESLQMQNCSKDLDQISMVQLETGHLSDITEGLLTNFQEICQLSSTQMKFLAELASDSAIFFVTWLKENFADDSDFQRFITVARQTLGESDKELSLLGDASKVVSDLQYIIFDLHVGASLSDLFAALQPVWTALASDEALIDKLGFMASDWSKLREIFDHRLDLEKSSIEQAKQINQFGVIKVGCLEENNFMKTVDGWVRIEVKLETETKAYSPSELRDLHSRLMLIGDQGGCSSEAKAEIEAFTTLYGDAHRLATACQQHYQAGNVLLSSWHCAFYSQRTDGGPYVEAKFASNLLMSIRETEKAPILEEIRALCKTLEAALEDWQRYVREVRQKYPILNQYTNGQIEFLRRKLAISVVEKRLDTESKMILMAVNSCPDIEDILKAVRDFMKNQDHDNALRKTITNGKASADHGDEREQFLRDLEANGIQRSLAVRAADAVKFSDVDDAIDWALNHDDQNAEGEQVEEATAYRPPPQGVSYTDHVQREIQRLASDSIGLMARKVESLWRAHMDLHEGCYSEFISLKCLGHILNTLAGRSHQEARLDKSARDLTSDFGLKTNEPNLLLAAEDDVYRFLVTMYQVHTGRLPDFAKVFVCSTTTTEQEIALFIEKVRSGAESDFFSIVDVQKLTGPSANELEHSLNGFISGINRPFQLLIFGAKENFEKCHAANGVLRFQRLLKNPETWLETRKFLTSCMAKEERKGDDWGMLAPETMAALFKVNLVTSIGYCHGKSLCVQRQLAGLRDRSRDDFAYIKIPIHDVQVDLDTLYDRFQANSELASVDGKNRLFHLDISNHQTRGVDTLLFQLFILGGFTTSTGRVWRIFEDDRYVAEISSTPNDLLVVTPESKPPTDLPVRYLLPIVLCHSPMATLQNLSEDLPPRNRQVVHRYCDVEWLSSERVQRCYWYLSNAHLHTDSNFASATYDADDEKCLLQTIRDACGIENPSWFEMENYVQFLNAQLVAVESCDFCNKEIRVVRDTFPGFRPFMVAFMKLMAGHFATRSLEIAEDVTSLEQERFQDVNAYRPKYRWEQNAHPYVFFNKDGKTMSFFGCYFNNNGDLIDWKTGQVFEGCTGMASKALMMGLVGNKVNLREPFDDLKCSRCKRGGGQIPYCNMCRREKLKILCRVFGVADDADPDKNYEITSDCVMKMLAIDMRLRCGIPTILMGETGCGKTKLIEFKCQLECHGRPEARNLVIFRMHGGITKQRIEWTVTEAIKLAKSNWTKYQIDTYLFFDEANTTPEVNFLKEIICDGSMNGIVHNARENHLRIVAAVNPYRKHDEAMIKRFESSGLGYHIGLNKVGQTFGKIAMRHLVYRVEPLSPSLIPFVIDFGSLSNDVERTYIRRMFDRFLQGMDACLGLRDPVSEQTAFELLAEVQVWMKSQKDETSFVSLRNIDRTLKVAEWFIRQSGLILEEVKRNSLLTITDLCRSILLAICVCYRASLLGEKRQQFDEILIRILHMPQPGQAANAGLIRDEIDACQDVFLSGIKLADNIAKNAALKENLFLMTLCIELGIPLFLIGRPGSSKSLAKTIIEENMRGQNSSGAVYKKLKQATMFSFQCSPLAKAEDIESIFRQAASHQRGKDLTKDAGVVIADEIGLAEDTLALKSLHGLLEEGARIDRENFEQYHKVSFVGISNWALDPAKMNRGIFVIRPIPDEAELTRTACVICQVDKVADYRVESLIDPLVRAYWKIYNELQQDEQQLEFFGLRDFYCLIKMISDISKQNQLRLDADGKTKGLRYEEVMKAIQRNFSGQENAETTLLVFEQELRGVLDAQFYNAAKPTVLIRENLAGRPSSQRLNRYLLILTRSDAALHVVRQISGLQDAEIIFGSGFPKDLEYTQICKNINKIKVCMDRGKTVILLNLDSLYESLYDLLNQSYITSSRKSFVDLGLGTHRLKCHVHPKFRLVVVADHEEAIRAFPAPLINRLEKHFLTLESELDSQQTEIVERLKEWMIDFCSFDGKQEIPLENAFIGYNTDTLAALVIDAEHKASLRGDIVDYEEILHTVQNQLIQCSTPEANLRLPKTDLRGEAEAIQLKYFREQAHSSFAEYFVKQQPMVDQRIMHITTHSRLLTQSDIERMADTSEIDVSRIHLLKNLNFFGTEEEFLTALGNAIARNSGSESTQFLIVQCNYRESDSALLASCCFILEKFVHDLTPEQHVRVFLICSLPRKRGGCYVGFRTGLWECVHIDQLVEINQDEAFVDLLSMRNKTMSILMQEYLHPREGNGVSSFDFTSLVADCLQLAASKIRDSSDRKLKRVACLLHLWKNDDDFARILGKRLLTLLTELERDRQEPQHWMLRQIDDLGFIYQNSTYIQSIRKVMESEITPLLAGLVSVLDIGANLNLIWRGEPENDHGSATKRLWIELFKEDVSFLDVSYVQTSSVYFENDDEGGLRARNEFPIDSTLPEFETPFYFALASKILQAVKMMESARGNLPLDAKVKDVAAYLSESTSWFSQVQDYLEQANITSEGRSQSIFDSYLIDIIRHSYPAADPHLEPFLFRWLKRELENQQYQPLVVGAQIANRSLTTRMCWVIELATTLPDELTIPAYEEMSAEEVTTLQNLNYEMDLFMAYRIGTYLGSKIPHLDQVTLITDQIEEERNSWLGLASRVTFLVNQILDESENRPAGYQDIKNCWFCISLCRSFLEHVQKADYLFKVQLIWDLAKRNLDGMMLERFWKNLENNLRLIYRNMNEEYKRRNSTPDTSTQEALLMFFMDVVHENFGRSETVVFDPSVAKFLLKYVIPGHTAGVIPFYDCNGNERRTAAFRSFILQIVCCYSINAVLAHIDECLTRVPTTEVDSQTILNFELLCVNSLEDALHLSFAQAACRNEKLDLENLLKHLRRVIQKGAVWYRSLENRRLAAPELLTIAEIRFVISSFATFIYKRSMGEISDIDQWDQIQREIQQFLSNPECTTIKTLLLKLLCRRYGRHMLVYCSEHGLDWVIDTDTIQNAQSPDPFVIYGSTYSDISNTLQTALAQRSSAAFENSLRQAESLDPGLIQVTLACAGLRLENLISQNHELSERLGHTLRISRALHPILSSWPKDFASLVWHTTATVSCSPGGATAEFFKTLLTTPEECNEMLFPTMDDDARHIFRVAGSEAFWYCPNGHLYLIGNCGRPWVRSQCNICRAQIGGLGHDADAGNIPAAEINAEPVKQGHILGSPGSFAPVGQRQLTKTEVQLTRCVLHATMIGSALMNGQHRLATSIKPSIPEADLLSFLRGHLEHDIEGLAHSFGRSRDDVVLLLHQFLRYWGRNQADPSISFQLITQQGREDWEECFANIVMRPILQNSQALIEEARRATSDSDSNSFWRMILQDKKATLEDPSRFWYFRPSSTLQSMIDQTMNAFESQQPELKNRMKVLRLFLTDMHQLSAVRHLLSIRHLHELLSSHFHGCVSIAYAEKTTIQQFLESSPNEMSVSCRPLIAAFFDAWRLTTPPDRMRQIELKCSGVFTRLPLITILPLHPETGSFSDGLIRTLVEAQNRILDAFSKNGGRHRREEIPYASVTSGQVISFDLRRDGLKHLMLHRSFDNSDPGVTHFDLDLMQRRVERFLLSSAVNITLSREPLMKAKEALLLECLVTLRDNKLGELTPTQIQEVIGWCSVSLSRTSELLEHLEIMIGFSSAIERSSFGCHRLSSFLRRFKPTAIHSILKSYTINHLVPLWQLAAFMVKRLLVETEIEDPFADLDKKYKSKLDVETRASLESALIGKSVLQFALEITEFMLLDLQRGCNSDIERFMAHRGDSVLKESLHDYIVNRRGSHLDEITIPETVLVQHVVDVWNLAATKVFEERNN